LQELGYADAVVATALNGEFVPAGSRPGARLSDGDRVEVLAPMQGG
jgi:sulfur carrier protein